MNREQAEKLLAALIFDELDEASKAELLAYLQTDDDLREHLADLRMAVKVSTDAVQQDPEPVLNPERYNKLAQLTQPQQNRWRRITKIRVFGSVAAVLIMGFVTVAWLGQQAKKPMAALVQSEADFVIPQASPATVTAPQEDVGGYVMRRRVDPHTIQGLVTEEVKLGAELAGGTSLSVLSNERSSGTDKNGSLEGLSLDSMNMAPIKVTDGEQNWYRKQTDTRGYAVVPEIEPVITRSRNDQWGDVEQQIVPEDNSHAIVGEDLLGVQRELSDTLERLEESSRVTNGGALYIENKRLAGTSLKKKENVRMGGGRKVDADSFAAPMGMGMGGMGGGSNVGNGGGMMGGMGGGRKVAGQPEEPPLGMGMMGGYSSGQRGLVADADGDDKSERYDSSRVVDEKMISKNDSSTKAVASQDQTSHDRYEEQLKIKQYELMGGEYSSEFKKKTPSLGDRPLKESFLAKDQKPSSGPTTWGYGEYYDGKEVVKNRPSSPQQPKTSTPQLQTSDEPQGIVYDDEFAYGTESAIADRATESVAKPTKPGNVTGHYGQSVSYGWEGTVAPTSRTREAKQESVDDREELKRQLDEYSSIIKNFARQDELGSDHNVEKEKPHQVLLETQIVNVPKDKVNDLGIVWSWPSERAGIYGAESAMDDEALSQEAEVHYGLKYDGTHSKELQKQLDHMEENNEVRIVASPRVVAKDGRTSEVRMTGERLGMDGNGGEFGTVWGVTPHLSDNEDILLSLDTEILGDSKGPGEGEGEHTFSNEVLLKDGGTVAIRVTDPWRKKEGDSEPDLSKIPVLGKLFRNGEKSDDREVVMLVTARKVPEESTIDSTTKLSSITQSSVTTTSVVEEESVIEDPTELPPSSRFKVVPVNPWVLSARDALSTFALDVDRASYDLCARYIRAGYRPPVGAVRMEEFVNAFDYNYSQRETPTFSVYTEAGRSPFAKAGQDLSLVKVAVKARTVGRDQQRPAHLVLVVDTSASMGQPDRLPAVQKALSELVTKLAPQDRVTLVSCSNEARLLLEAVSAQETDEIQTTIQSLQPSGHTNLLTGLQLGYQTARRVFRAGELNHVVLCSDGVANVGATESEVLLRAVAKDRAQGITITTVGVGYGAYNDTLLESLANQGDGSYMYLDATPEAHEQFVKHLCAAMQVVAKDARIQVAFDPQVVRRYRLIGYENRDLEDQRFRDDTVDAGEVGSGQCSTALYEIELLPDADAQAKLATVFVRYRDMQTNAMQEISQVVTKRQIQDRAVSESPRFYLAAVAARFAEWLRESEHMMGGGLAEVRTLAQKVSQELPLDKDVQELVELIETAEHLPMAP